MADGGEREDIRGRPDRTGRYEVRREARELVQPASGRVPLDHRKLGLREVLVDGAVGEVAGGEQDAAESLERLPYRRAVERDLVERPLVVHLGTRALQQ